MKIEKKRVWLRLFCMAAGGWISVAAADGWNKPFYVEVPVKGGLSGHERNGFLGEAGDIYGEMQEEEGAAGQASALSMMPEADNGEKKTDGRTDGADFSKRLNFAYYYDNGTDAGDVSRSYAGRVYEKLLKKEASWMSGIFGLRHVSPEAMAVRLGMDKSAVAGRRHLNGVPLEGENNVRQIPSWNRFHVTFRNGDGTAVMGHSNIKEILSLASVYGYYNQEQSYDFLLTYGEKLWNSSHSYKISVSSVYYCQGECLYSKGSRQDENLAGEEGAASVGGESGTEESTSEEETTVRETADIYMRQNEFEPADVVWLKEREAQKAGGETGESGESANQENETPETGAASSEGSTAGSDGQGGLPGESQAVSGAEGTAPAEGQAVLGTEGTLPAESQQDSGTEGTLPQESQAVSGAEGAPSAEGQASSGTEGMATVEEQAVPRTGEVLPAESQGSSGTGGALAPESQIFSGTEGMAPAEGQSVPGTDGTLPPESQASSGTEGTPAPESQVSSGTEGTLPAESRAVSGAGSTSGEEVRESGSGSQNTGESTQERGSKTPAKDTKYCDGHIDLNISAVIVGMDETKSLFELGIFPEDGETSGAWPGWDETARGCARAIADQDWYAEYGLSSPEATFVQNPLSGTEITSYMDLLPNDTSEKRREIIRQALSSVGCIPYYWGGKPSRGGFEGNGFGTVVAPDEDGRILKGLDCSGWINWVYWTSLGTSLPAQSTSGLTGCGRAVEKKNLKAGDILIRAGDQPHVYMFLAWAQDGSMYLIHETTGNVNNVTVGTYDLDLPYYRCLINEE
ncbi:MAG: hypothetical protein HFG73_06245 [Hungatella sp.]|nr:hypothetical protein [Hungatella sp.]